MNPISAGMLTRRIKIQRPSTIKDSVGAPCRSWLDVATVWADIQPLSGKEAVIANRISAELSHQIIVRYQSLFDNPQQVAQALEQRSVVEGAAASKLCDQFFHPL